VTNPASADRIYHLTFASDWNDAQSTGEYRLSTRGTGLDEVGYIHASFAHQVQRIGAAVYGDVPEPVVVLAIDPTLLGSMVRVENLEGGTEGFPHIYGPLPTSAVVEVLPARVDGGEFVVAGLARRG
jgi:uncharacterized protein (DUF952 family)